MRDTSGNVFYEFTSLFMDVLTLFTQTHSFLDKNGQNAVRLR